MKLSYHIGEMASYFGVSNDTLRLYDKKGILSPKKEENGYRVYSREDMIYLDYVIRLRRLGLPLKDIKRLADEGSIVDAERVLEVQQRTLIKRMEELKSLYSITQDYRGILKETRENMDNIHIVMSPRIILRFIDDSFIRAASAFKKLNTNLTPCFCTLTNPEDVLVEGYDANIYNDSIRNGAQKNAVAMLDRENIVSVPKNLSREFVVLEPARCAYMAARCHSKTDYEAFIRIRRFVLENGYGVAGDMVSVFVAVRCGPRKADDYYQIYIPIK